MCQATEPKLAQFNKGWVYNNLQIIRGVDGGKRIELRFTTDPKQECTGTNSSLLLKCYFAADEFGLVKSHVQAGKVVTVYGRENNTTISQAAWSAS